MDAATKDNPKVDLAWLLQCHYSFISTKKYKDHYLLAPLNLQN